MSGILETRRQIVFRCAAAGDSQTVETALATVNKRGFENQKQLAARLLRVARYHKLQICVQPLLMAEVKSVALSAKDRFGIPAKDKAPAGLRKGDIKMRTEPSTNRCELLSHKRR